MNADGAYSSIAVGTDGYPLISYYDANAAKLYAVHCTAADCATYDAPLDIGILTPLGTYSSITIGADGLGLISFYAQVSTRLGTTHCNNVSCTSSSVSFHDATGSVGTFTSITTGADGLGLVSYYDTTNQDLKVAHCTNAACSTSTQVTLDSTGTVGTYTSIAQGADGLPLIAYYDTTNQDLKVAHCATSTCTAASTTVVDSTITNVGEYASLVIGVDGYGLIAYADTTSSDLRAAHCSIFICTPNQRG